MAHYSREELEHAFETYSCAVRKAEQTGDWNDWADCFTEDARYIEHAYGEFQGRESIREWIHKVMAPYPTMVFPVDWVVYDEDNGAIVLCVQNALPCPKGTEKLYGFPNWTRLVYAGNGLFSEEEDIYNPNFQAPDVIKEWLKAGGQFASSEQVSMKHQS